MVQIRGVEKHEFPYDAFLEREELPIVRAEVGLGDLTKLPRKDWERTGGKGAYLDLVGTFQNERGLYVCEIPGGGALNPERHLYEEQIYVLRGRGTAEVWQGTGKKLAFEWQESSVFAFPRNCWHRLYNAGREPVIFLGVTTAPRIINSVVDLDFVFDCEYEFEDLYRDEGNYFHAPDARTQEGWYNETVWHTNFIPDARKAVVNPQEQKVAGGDLTGYRMGRYFPCGHISQWPQGRYHKAHYHHAGALLLGLDGEGYVLAWPSALGAHPYQDGHGDQVVRVEWGRDTIYCPPDAWFHQHFNSGVGPARHVAVYGIRTPLGVHGLDDETGWKGFKSYKEGGTLIEYQDEDPQIRADFERTLAQKGIELEMPSLAHA